MIEDSWKPLPENCLVGLMIVRCWGCRKATTFIAKKTNPINLKQAIDESKQYFKDHQIYFMCMNCAAKMAKSVAVNPLTEEYAETDDGAKRFHSLVDDTK